MQTIPSTNPGPAPKPTDPRKFGRIIDELVNNHVNAGFAAFKRNFAQIIEQAARNEKDYLCFYLKRKHPREAHEKLDSFLMEEALDNRSEWLDPDILLIRLHGTPPRGFIPVTHYIEDGWKIENAALVTDMLPPGVRGLSL